MRNCINFISHPPHEKIKVVIRKGGQHKFKASTPVQAIASSPHTGYKLAQPYMPLAPNTKPDLAIHLAKYLVPSKLVRQEGCKRKKIKIVVTREELELLLKSMNKRWSKENGVRLSGRFGLEPPKWQPCLAIIPEVHHFGMIGFWVFIFPLASRYLYSLKNSITDFPGKCDREN